MKKQYVKPEIYFEHFSMAQTIARNCGASHDSTVGEPTHYDENTCTWDVGGYIIFFDHCDDEQLEPGVDSEIGALCYNNPGGGQEVFSSM